MKEYDDDTLKKVQQTELEILHDFVEICEQNHLTYFGIAGTGIGALRHGGFIPWDDDIDIAMPRKDFELFIKIAKKQYGGKYCVLNCIENPNFPLMTTRWMLKGTQFVEHSLRHVNCEMGIFLDLYPLDNIPDNDAAYKNQARTAFIFSKLMILRSVPFPVLAYSGIKAKMVHAICACIYFFMAVLRIKKTWLCRKCYEASTMYKDFEDSKRIAFVGDTTPYDCIYYKDEIYPLRKVDFEDTQINLPAQIEKKLQETFGDWQTLPPVEKRKNHCPDILSFGE